ncbi:uncharacterized protein LOC129789769 [Lutzomyia longipalpis]|uniref:uncharacterized protein LOC129789769 n=1 Tax=Lutzomyia longipalpis TaxID=7200 RepID=UPI0024838B2F|nr:uncharacterized protein LOC129789769 [Lutzomyia longipalpis]
MSSAKEEYEIQHYGFPLEQLKFDTKEMIKHEINNAMNKIFLSLKNKNVTDTTLKNKLEVKREKIMGNMQKIIDRKFQKLNEAIDRHLTIPPYVLLPENQMHDIRNPQYTEADEKELREQFEEKKKQFEENIALLQEVNKINEAFLQLEPAFNTENALHAILQEALGEGMDTSSLKKNLRDISEIVDKLQNK